MSNCPSCDVHAKAWRIWLLRIDGAYSCERCGRSSRIPRGEMTRVGFGWILPVAVPIGVVLAAWCRPQVGFGTALVFAAASSGLLAAIASFVMKQRCRLVRTDAP